VPFSSESRKIFEVCIDTAAVCFLLNAFISLYEARLFNQSDMTFCVNMQSSLQYVVLSHDIHGT